MERGENWFRNSGEVAQPMKSCTSDLFKHREEVKEEEKTREREKEKALQLCINRFVLLTRTVRTNLTTRHLLLLRLRLLLSLSLTIDGARRVRETVLQVFVVELKDLLHTLPPARVPEDIRTTFHGARPQLWFDARPPS